MGGHLGVGEAFPLSFTFLITVQPASKPKSHVMPGTQDK